MGWQALRMPLGIMPKGTQNAIPSDIRAEHYGVVVTRHLQTRARVLMVDRRSSRKYLPPAAQLTLPDNAGVFAGSKGESCNDVCSLNGQMCQDQLIHFLN